MAAATHSMTPYQYGNNNPIIMNDPMGDLSAQFLQDMYNNASDGEHFVSTGDGVFVGSGGDNFLDSEDGYAPVQGLNSGGGHVFTVDKRGDINPFTFSGYRPPSGIDILFAVDNFPNQNTDPSTAVDEGILDAFQKDSNGKHVALDGNQRAKDLFSFLAANTEVEWALIQFGGDHNF